MQGERKEAAQGLRELVWALEAQPPYTSYQELKGPNTQHWEVWAPWSQGGSLMTFARADDSEWGRESSAMENPV